MHTRIRNLMVAAGALIALPIAGQTLGQGQTPAIPLQQPGQVVAGGTAQDGGQSAKDILQALRDLEAMKPLNTRAIAQDVEARAVYNAQNSFYMTKRVKLIGDLWRAAPDHPQLASLMIYRWQNANRIYGLDTVSEITAFAKRHPEAEEAVKTGRFYLANAAIPQLRNNPEKMETTVNDFIDAYPGDDMGAQLLYNMSRYVTDENAALAVNRRMIAEFPDSRYAAGAKGKIRQLEGIGRPFELTFTDHISGRAISMDELRGKVVVIDFWATWCGPCKAEIPHMKELYAQYKNQGVQFIGISSDWAPEKGGDAALTTYCKENGITWPQYYQGGTHEFSRPWGITGIPTLFIIDKEGNLYSTKARGKLEELIPLLLEN